MLTALFLMDATFSAITPLVYAQALKATMLQIASLPGVNRISGVDLIAAFDFLSVGREEDTPVVGARRWVLRDIVAGVDADLRVGGDPAKALEFFRAQVTAFGGSTDPRQQAMAATAARELAELMRR
jgi:hypothetical protein